VLDRAEQVAQVGNAQGQLPVVLGCGHRIVDPQGAIDDGVFGVQAQVNKTHRGIVRSGVRVLDLGARCHGGVTGAAKTGGRHGASTAATPKRPRSPHACPFPGRRRPGLCRRTGPRPCRRHPDCPRRADLDQDLSGLTNTLENGQPANLFGGIGSGLAWAGGSTFLALGDRGPNAVAWNSTVDDTTSWIPASTP
jgi:hypothetical protein